MDDLMEMCGGIDRAKGLGTKVDKAVDGIAQLEAQWKAAGRTLPLPDGYHAEPEGFIHGNAVLRVPDDHVAQARKTVVDDLMDPNNPFGWSSFGLKGSITRAEAEAFATRRIKGIGTNYADLLK